MRVWRSYPPQQRSETIPLREEEVKLQAAWDERDDRYAKRVHYVSRKSWFTDPVDEDETELIRAYREREARLIRSNAMVGVARRWRPPTMAVTDHVAAA